MWMLSKKVLPFNCVHVKGTDVTTVIEQYMNRRDHLEQRTIDKVDGFTTDVFKHGRRFHLKRNSRWF